jgi:hypothetical protein
VPLAATCTTTAHVSTRQRHNTHDTHPHTRARATAAAEDWGKGARKAYENVDVFDDVKEDFVFSVLDSLRAPAHRRGQGGRWTRLLLHLVELLCDEPAATSTTGQQKMRKGAKRVECFSSSYSSKGKGDGRLHKEEEERPEEKKRNEAGLTTGHVVEGGRTLARFGRRWLVDTRNPSSRREAHK